MSRRQGVEPKILSLTANQAIEILPELAALLQDVVDNGGTVGFLPPLSLEDAIAYWREVVSALKGSHRILLIAKVDNALVGTVQLDLATRQNARHRAEVMKLMVHSRFRRQGIASALMRAIEQHARDAGRTTLVLDTREGEPSEQLYRNLGYIKSGAIPEYAESADGSLHTTVIFYKLLKD